jgi:hypothetical protein
MFETEHVKSVADITRMRAAMQPDAIAQVFAGRETSYGELDRRASQVAQVYANLAAFWRQVGSELEQLRLGTIAGIEGATDQAGIDAILAGFRETAELYKNV